MRHALTVISLGALAASCEAPPAGPAQNGQQGEANVQSGAEERQTRIENLPPRDEGYAIQRVAGFLANAPSVTVDAQHTGQDKADLEAYVRAATAALTSQATADHATGLNGTYPRVWLNETTQYEGLGSVGALTRAPRTGFSYMPARLVMANSGTGAAESKDPNSANGGRLITIRRYHLDWWRSNKAVTRSCAVNTLAHEITHNMTRDPATFRWAFTDTGLSNSVTSEKGSYMMGALAQCSQLQSAGRITAAQFAQCVPVWGLRDTFMSSRCDDFDDTEAVKWPRDPKPGP